MINKKIIGILICLLFVGASIVPNISGDEPSSNYTLYAGSSNPGIVYKYTGDTNWEPISNELGFAVLDLVEFEGHLYAATMSDMPSYGVGKVWRYIGGTNWIEVVSLDNQVCDLEVWNNKLYAGTAWNGGKLYQYNAVTDTFEHIGTMPNTDSLGNYHTWGGIRAMYSWSQTEHLHLGDIAYDCLGRYDGTNMIYDAYLGGSCIYDFAEFNNKLYAAAWAGRLLWSSTGIGHSWNNQYFDGSTIWEVESFQDYLYMGNYYGQLRRLDASHNHEVVWTTPLGDSFQQQICSMVTDGDNLYFGTGGEASYYGNIDGIASVYKYDGTNSPELISNWDGMGAGVQVLYISEEENLPPDPPINPNPEDGTKKVSFNPLLYVDVSDPDGDNLDVTFYNAEDDSIIGTDSDVPSGETATVGWSGLEEETIYYWYAVANDGIISTTSNKWSFKTKPNKEPKVHISTPKEGDTVFENLIIIGTADDGDNEVTLVEIKIGNNDWVAASGTDFWLYVLDISNTPSGKLLIEARSYDGKLYSTLDSVIVNVAPYFIHVTDTHANWRIPQGEGDWEKMVECIKGFESVPSFVICSGDIAEYGVDLDDEWPAGTANYLRFLAPIEKNGDKLFIVSNSGIDIPLFCSPGNHDYRNMWLDYPPKHSCENYRTRICKKNHGGWSDYSENIKELNLGVISMESGYDVNPTLLPEGSGLHDDQILWLTEELANMEKRNIENIVIFMHHPYINGYQSNKENGVFVENREDFYSLCKEYQVDLVLSGHDHVAGEKHGGVWDCDGNEWNEGDGTKFVITNSVKGNHNYRKIYVTEERLEIGGSTKAFD